MMKYSGKGLQLTKSFESCRLVAYQDSGGVWTIGWGHTQNVYSGMTCTQSQADAWLLSDMVDAENAVRHLVKVALTQEEYDALVDFTFNVGAGNFAHSTLLALLNAGNYSAAAEQFERWHHVNGKDCAGLMRRRLAEEALFKEGM